MRNYQKLVTSVGVGALSLLPLASQAVIDTADITDAITDAATAGATVAAAVVVMIVGIKAFKWLRRAL